MILVFVTTTYINKTQVTSKFTIIDIDKLKDSRVPEHQGFMDTRSMEESGGGMPTMQYQKCRRFLCLDNLLVDFLASITLLKLRDQE